MSKKQIVYNSHRFLDYDVFDELSESDNDDEVIEEILTGSYETF